MPIKLDELVVELKASDKGFDSSFAKAQRNLSKFQKQVEKDTEGIQNSLNRLQRQLLVLGTAYAAFRVGKGIIDAGVQVEAMRNRMLAATGDARIAGQALEFVREEANRLGLDIRAASNGFAGFSASALRAGLTFQQTKEIFTGVSEAATSMRLPAEQTALVFKALEQIAGKGTVSMEELRGQLGDALPGAFEIAAKAMGKSTSEFSKMVANGEVMSADFLPRFGAAIRKELGGSVEEASKGAQAAFNRLGNAFFELQAKLAASGMLDAVVNSVHDLSAALNDPATVEGLKGFASLLGDIAGAAVKAAIAVGGLYSTAQQRKADLLAATEGQSLFVPNGPRGFRFNKMDPQAALADAASTRSLRERVLADFEAKQKAIAAARAGSPSSDSYTLGSISRPTENSGQQRAQEKAQRLREQLAGQADSLRYQFAGPEQQAAMDVEKQQETLRDALEAKAITEQEFRDLSLQAEVAYQEQLKEVRDKAREDEQSAFKGFLGIRYKSEQELRNATIQEQAKSFQQSISQAAQHNRIFFALEKARAIASALISARESVVHAYNFGSRLGGPPLGAAFAGIAAAAQAANIAAIASTSFNGGGGNVSSSGTGGSAPETGGSESGGTAAAPAKSVYITLNGDDATFYSKNQIRKLLEGINDALGDGSQLKVAVSA